MQFQLPTYYHFLGVLDPPPRYSSLDSWQIYLHFRSEIFRSSRSHDTLLAASDQRIESRRRGKIWMSSLYNSSNGSSNVPKSRRWEHSSISKYRCFYWFKKENQKVGFWLGNCSMNCWNHQSLYISSFAMFRPKIVEILWPNGQYKVIAAYNVKHIILCIYHIPECMLKK